MSAAGSQKAGQHNNQKDHWADPFPDRHLRALKARIALAEHNQADDAVKPRLDSHKALAHLMTGRSCSLFTMCKIAGGAGRCACKTL
jgi:hypothetical protein